MLDPTASTALHGDQFPGGIPSVVNRAIDYDDGRELDQPILNLIPFVGAIKNALDVGGQIFGGLANMLDGGTLKELLEKMSDGLGWLDSHTEITVEGEITGADSSRYQHIDVRNGYDFENSLAGAADTAATVGEFLGTLGSVGEQLNKLLNFAGWIESHIPQEILDRVGWVGVGATLEKAAQAILSHMHFGDWYRTKQLCADLDSFMLAKQTFGSGATRYESPSVQAVNLPGAWS